MGGPIEIFCEKKGGKGVEKSEGRQLVFLNPWKEKKTETALPTTTVTQKPTTKRKNSPAREANTV